MARRRKHKCTVCGLWEWAGSPHTGAMHDAIRAARRRGGRKRR